MKKITSVHILRVYAMFLAGYLDMCVGLFLTLCVAYLLNMPLSAGHYIGGMTLAVLPDFDLLFLYFIKRQTTGNHHELLSHRPLFTLPLATAIAYKLGGSFWGLLAGCALLWHFIHDTEGFGGGGIAWIWPFSKKYYSLSGGKEPISSHAAAVLDFHKWLRDYWLWPSRQSLVETALGSLLFGIVLYLNFGLLRALLSALLIPASTILAWTLHAKLAQKK